MEDANARSASLQHHLESAQAELEEAVLQRIPRPYDPDDTERELFEQNKKFRGLQIELDELRQRHIKDSDQLEQSTEDIAVAHKEITSLQEALQQRNVELHDLLDSNSWKVTSPMRYAKDTLTGRSKKKD